MPKDSKGEVMSETITFEALRELMEKRIGWKEQTVTEAKTFPELVEAFYWIAEDAGATNYAESDYS